MIKDLRSSIKRFVGDFLRKWQVELAHPFITDYVRKLLCNISGRDTISYSMYVGIVSIVCCVTCLGNRPHITGHAGQGRHRRSAESQEKEHGATHSRLWRHGHELAGWPGARVSGVRRGRL